MTNDQAIAVQARLETATEALKAAYDQLMPDNGQLTPPPEDDEAIEMLSESLECAQHVLEVARQVTGVC